MDNYKGEVRVRERSVSVSGDGFALQVLEWNHERSGVPVVLLHGWMDQALSWGPVARRLPHWCIAPDQRGFGRSSHVGVGGHYHFWDYVADLDGLVTALGADRFHLVGHSMGGTVAALYASCRPEQIASLILVDGLGPIERTDHPVEQARQFLDDRKKRIKPSRVADEADAVSRLSRGIPGADATQTLEMARRILAPADGAWTWTFDPKHRWTSPQPFQEALFVRYLERITAPTTLVFGDLSPYAKLNLNARKRSIPNVVHEVSIDGAGHGVHHDQPIQLAEVLGRAIGDAA